MNRALIFMLLGILIQACGGDGKPRSEASEEDLLFFRGEVSSQDTLPEVSSYQDLIILSDSKSPDISAVDVPPAPDLVEPDEVQLPQEVADSQPQDTEEVDPWVQVITPAPGDAVANPVEFEFLAGGGVVTVGLFVSDWPLQDSPVPVEAGRIVYSFNGVGYYREVEARGFDAEGNPIAFDHLSIIPISGNLEQGTVFNQYVLRAIADWQLYPKNGTYPYCWHDCPGSMGMIHSTSYLGEHLWDGEGSCFCTGHALEIFLDAYSRWQEDNNVPITQTFGGLTRASVKGGSFYQHWQGYGVTDYASSADALESEGIGYNIDQPDWESASAGDFLNISRTNGTGHSIIFMEWVRDGDEIIGIRYYGCNGGGDSYLNPDDPGNTSSASGPSYITEYFSDFGGQVIPYYVFLGRVLDPGTP